MLDPRILELNIQNANCSSKEGCWTEVLWTVCSRSHDLWASAGCDNLCFCHVYGYLVEVTQVFGQAIVSVVGVCRTSWR